MRFTQTPLAGSCLIDLDKQEDERGFFARLFCEREFGEAGLESRLVQMNISVSRDRGTLRGMHYQLEPAAEVKVVRALRGALWEVILDLRPGSPTFGRSFGTELTAGSRRMMYVPRGFAQGFLTLESDTEALYLVSTYYDPSHERGVRWNDPRFSIAWPEKPLVISDKDANHPDFDPLWHLNG